MLILPAIRKLLIPNRVPVRRHVPVRRPPAWRPQWPRLPRNLLGLPGLPPERPRWDWPLLMPSLDMSGCAPCCGGCCACTEDIPLLTMTLTSTSPGCECVTGHEFQLTGICSGGRIIQLDDLNPGAAYPCDAGREATVLDTTCNPDAPPGENWQVNYQVNIPGVTSASCGTADPSDITVHSCNPLHITGTIVLDLAVVGACAIFCETATPPDVVVIEFEITE